MRVYGFADSKLSANCQHFSLSAFFADSQQTNRQQKAAIQFRITAFLFGETLVKVW